MDFLTSQNFPTSKYQDFPASTNLDFPISKKNAWWPGGRGWIDGRMGEQGVDVDSIVISGLPWMGMQAGVWDPGCEPVSQDNIQ